MLQLFVGAVPLAAFSIASANSLYGLRALGDGQQLIDATPAKVGAEPLTERIEAAFVAGVLGLEEALLGADAMIVCLLVAFRRFLKMHGDAFAEIDQIGRTVLYDLSRRQ